MKLILNRAQPTGILGSIKFELKARIDLTPEEAELVKRYHVGKLILLDMKVTIPFT